MQNTYTAVVKKSRLVDRMNRGNSRGELPEAHKVGINRHDVVYPERGIFVNIWVSPG